MVAAMSTYNANSGRGSIVLRPLDANNAALSPAVDKTALAAATVSAEAPSPNQSVKLFSTTPKVAKNKKKKHRMVVDTPEVTAQSNTKLVAARVSIDSNAGNDLSTNTLEGVAVSPEQMTEINAALKQKPKKNGAMMKYLRPADGGKTDTKISSVRTSAVPRRLLQEPGGAKPKHATGGDVKKAPASVSKKLRAKTPPKEKLQNVSDKTGRKLKDASNRPSKSVEKVRQKRVRSPCVPRKRQKSPAVAQSTASHGASKNDSLRKFKYIALTFQFSFKFLYLIISCSPLMTVEVAEALCDIRRGTPSPKRARPSTGMYTKKTLVKKQARPSHPHRKRPRALASQLPKASILERVGTQVSGKTDLISLHEASRMKMAAEHRAGHELLRKRVLSTVDSIARSLSRPEPISDSEARIWFNEEMHGFKNLLDDLIERQRMESSALAAQQSLQQKGYSAPELQVSFPFPGLFDTANRAFEQFMDEEKTSI